MGKAKTLNEILESVKAEDEAALSEEALLKELESSVIDDALLKDGSIDDIAVAQSWEKRRAAVELRRQIIKDRIRMASSNNVEYIHANKDFGVKAPGPKKVAVYARVSTKSLDQTSSIKNQARYYKDKIEKTPDWELYKIYSDEGKSGTSTRWRPEFNQMMQDAKDKKFDLILCASVSRFARNISECLKHVSKLKTMNPTHPVSVYFESEGIDTLDPTTSQNLDIHALMADWESRIKSGRMILSYDQRIFTGQFPVCDLLGYRHTKAGKLVMVPEEAKTVRLIFLAYLCGYSCKEIADILTEKQRPTLTGRTDWNESMVKNIMLNERRWGDLQARKYIVSDYKEKTVVKNNGIREAAYVKKHHTGIVSPEIAKAVQYLFPNRSRITGHQEVYVIPSGSLKGFVNINPSWYAASNTAFLDLCCEVYSDDELEELKNDSKILSGEAHSNIIDMEFAGYQVPYGIYFLTQKMPSMTIGKKSLKFNKACHTRFDDCEFVEVLYHPILQMVAVRACSKETPTSIRWKSEEGKIISSIHTKAFSDAIFERMNWIKDYSFQFRGFYRENGDAKIIFFSLDEPRIHIGKNKETAAEAENRIQFIPYKNEADALDESIGCHSYAYPSEWQTCFGLNSKMRERRDRLAENITAADIMTEGTCAVNPLIGELPTKQELLEELEELMISM